MKLTKILPLIPIVALLASCAQTSITLPNGDNMVSEKQTEAPYNFVVYPDDRPSIPDGKAIYTAQNCASCHGANGETPQGSHPALADKIYMGDKKPVELYKFLTYKGDPHKLQSKLSTKEIWNLVFYARSLSYAPLSQAEIDGVAAVFGSNCAVCHGTKGDGEGPLGRNLEPNPANFTTFRRFYDRTDNTLFDHIANGIQWEGMPNFLGKEDKKKNYKFDHENIRKLVQYVRNFHVSNESTTAVTASAAAATATPTPAAPDSSTPAATPPVNPAATPPASSSSAAPVEPANASSSETPVSPKAEGDEAKKTAADDATGTDTKTAGESAKK